MIIECPSCHSRYQYDEDRFERKPSKKIRCARCQTVFDIQNPAYSKPKPSASKGDSTTPTAASPPLSRSALQETTDQAPIPNLAPMDGPLQMPPGIRLSLAILDGPGAGSVFRIDKPRVTIGRSGADLALDDTEVSRLHAAIEVRDTCYSVSDLGSTNGTLVNGTKIGEPVELNDKSEFQVGATTLMLIVTHEQ